MSATRNREASGGDELTEAMAAPAESKRAIALRYVGDGASLPDVPARDIQADEIDQYDRKALIASGLYEAA